MQLRYDFTVSLEFSGYTLYEYLVRHMPEHRPGIVKKMGLNGLVKNNGKVAGLTDYVHADDEIKIRIPKDMRAQYLQKPVEIGVIFEAPEFLVVDKPSGIAVVPERWSHKNPFKDAVKMYLSDRKGENCEPRIVHRIDREASGAVVVARNAEMERYLSRLFEDREIDKEYLALVAGIPQEKGTIELKIAQASSHSNRMTISEFGKSAVTHYEVVEAFRDFALVKVKIETGRTHQIRVHMASQGYPLAVDELYGFRNCIKLSDLKEGYVAKKHRPEKPLISRLTLHARKISFLLPDGSPFSVECPLPEDFQLVLKMLRKYRSQGGAQECPVAP